MNCFTMALDCKSFINVIKTFNPANQNLKKILMKKMHLYSGNNNLAQIHVFPNPLIINNYCCSGKEDSLVRAQLPSL